MRKAIDIGVFFFEAPQLTFVWLVQCVTSDDKMNSFSVVSKKTPFKKHREEEDTKNKVS